MPASKRPSHSSRKPTPPLLPKRKPEGQQILTPAEAAELVKQFKVLANGSRLRLLHALVLHGEMCVTDLAKVLGMKPQAVSNQLQRLVDQRILGSDRRGNHVYYRILEPHVPHLLSWHLGQALHRGPRP